tara:strand:- start:416 stop:907 length:492 start_codon:yes stop_codon:yes gene_type:complete
VSQQTKSYDFQSIGQAATEIEKQIKPLSGSFALPIGIKTPVELGYGPGGLLRMSTNLGKQIADNFRNMLATNHGERPMLHDFGANLLPLAFDLTSESADIAAVRRIKATTEKYMPFIRLETFEPFKEEPLPQYLAKSGVRITYSVPTLNLKNQVVEVIIYAGA